ncbi:DNA N-6-adenine-methyltransferase [Pseudoalteromonas piscicida]|uniref:DNA N-6-adenine-methyltransferase n=1 Tax=Pseudoalteromonas piscicida TaxID=43662 RepID=UPI0005FA2701|nr:DNA N-6-adenine-methyltransferase [Pseudoalteromonas piscicida]KJZ03256.1 hypothetical protein TW73_08880 [Pseudoalteromonas piscicida]
MGNDELINQDSGCVEYYTPPEILAYVHRMFPVIELDPASCETANQNVKALRFFNKENDALKQQWHAKTVWMNHPFSKGEKACGKKCKKKVCNDPTYKKYRGHCIDSDIPSNGDWVDYYLGQFNAGNIKEAMNITFVSCSEAWCQKLLNAGLSCFLDGRTHFHDESNKPIKGAPKGCFITYLGNRKDEFRAIFSEIGVVK